MNLRRGSSDLPNWGQAGLHVLDALEAGEAERKELAEKLIEVILAQRLTAQRVAIYIATATAGGGGAVALVMRTLGGD